MGAAGAVFGGRRPRRRGPQAPGASQGGLGGSAPQKNFLISNSTFINKTHSFNKKGVEGGLRKGSRRASIEICSARRSHTEPPLMKSEARLAAGGAEDKVSLPRFGGLGGLTIKFLMPRILAKTN